MMQTIINFITVTMLNSLFLSKSTEMGRFLPFSDAPPKCLQQPGLSQAKARGISAPSRSSILPAKAQVLET